jgi:uncharacterized SAM-binding protein YcdF (DUF218 family)
MEIILHLGGNYQRARKAAEIAASLPESKVVVSSEGGDFYQYYDAAGIDRSRIIVDNAAWDTVTNFTHTYKLLRNLGCTRLFVVTDFFHCYRSALIAFACWGLRVPIYMVPNGFSLRPEDEKYAMGDLKRALLWRFFGLLLFDKKTREQRQPGYKPSNEHARWEIGL